MWRHSIRLPLIEEQSEVSRSLKTIVWILMGATPLLLIGIFTVPHHSTRWLVLLGSAYVVCISPLILNRRGHTQLAAFVLVVGLWMLFTGAALTAGGIASFAAIYYVMIVFVAGLLFGQRAAITTAVLCILTTLSMVVMETTGTIRSNVLPYTPLARWTGITLLTLIIMGLQYLSVRRVHDALNRSQQELQERQRTEAKFRVLAETAGSVILIYQDGKYRYANPAAVAITGYSKEEILGMGLGQLVHPEFRDLVVSRALARERGENVPSRYEVKIVTKNGDERWLDTAGNWMEFEGKPARLVTAFDITERKRAEEQLLFSREQLRALSERLRRAKEEEGVRIARELHDELGSALTSLKWSLLDLKKADSANNEKIVDMVELVDETINVVRRISSELRPGVLDDLGLVSAIEWHGQQFQANSGIECECDLLVDDVDLNREQSTVVFRILQEAMTNILRHAGATKVSVVLEEEEGEIVLEVNDNGRGITEIEKLGGAHSLGLLGMRERANSIGGSIEIMGTNGGGTRLVLHVPVESKVLPQKTQ